MAGETKKRTQSSSDAQEKKYQLISKSTVQLFAESKGFDISEEVVRVLTEDLNYRLREAVSEASQYLKHSQRSQLQVSDIIHALSDSHVPYLPTNTGEDKPASFQQLSESKIWSPADKLLDLKTVVTEKIPPNTDHQPPLLEVSWLNTSPSLTQPSMDSRKCLSSYFTEITEAAMSTDSQIRHLALADLICNPNVSYVRDQMLCFIEKWVKGCIENKKSMRSALDLLDAFTNNPRVLFSLRKPMEKIISIVLDSFLLADTSSLPECHYSNQIYAANILNKCLRCESYEDIRRSTLSRCADVVADSRSSSSHILGSLRVIFSLNVTELFELLSPNMVSMWLTSPQFSSLQLLLLQHSIQDGVAAILNSLDSLKMSYNHVVQWTRSIINSLDITVNRLPLCIGKTAATEQKVVTLPVRNRCLKRTKCVTVTNETAMKHKIDLSEMFESSLVGVKPIVLNYGESRPVASSSKMEQFTRYSDSDGKQTDFRKLYTKYHSHRHYKLRQCKDVVLDNECFLYEVL